MDVKHYAEIYSKLVELNKETENVIKEIRSKSPEELLEFVYSKIKKFQDGLSMFLQYLFWKGNKHLAEEFINNLAINILTGEKVRNNQKLASSFESLDEDNYLLVMILSAFDSAFREVFRSLLE
jgi:hypothetical protein